MANINCGCGNCGSKDLRVRTSESMGLRSGSFLLVCNSCGARNHGLWEIIKLETPNYVERPEYLRANTPLKNYNPNQTEIPME
ncbi:hypothetical protein [Pasteurella bettyae]|uniref:Phage transcriptional activator, Ogr/Delta n=1 Tax=Pasteurella bettyae CCUG 2042 TaxID=1095749 RepID=I3DK94_9PAST|nr:hypothetical protein [Pasteurella bettyae]EIJ72137.1 hypothetical protein HMPREF1052_2049 [Pasteurella bettyae CCUG 2042]SUB20782.1 Uncharacterised protein [Pasteurella bettyae]